MTLHRALAGGTDGLTRHVSRRGGHPHVACRVPRPVLRGTPGSSPRPTHPLSPRRGSRSRRTKNNAPVVNGQDVEQNEGLHPHIWWTKTIDFVHVYRGILPMNRVFFPTSAVCLGCPIQTSRAFQRRQ